MKKILIPLLVAALLLTVFVACGDAGSEMKDDMTTMMEEASTALDEMMDQTEGRGEVTEDETTEEDITDEETTGEDMTTDVTEDRTTEESLLGDVTE